MKELPETLRFLAETPEGQEIAKEIAEAGREWVGKAWRVVDMRVATFRILLEYARLYGEERDRTGECPWDRKGRAKSWMGTCEFGWMYTVPRCGYPCAWDVADIGVVGSLAGIEGTVGERNAGFTTPTCHWYPLLPFRTNMQTTMTISTWPWLPASYQQPQPNHLLELNNIQAAGLLNCNLSTVRDCYDFGQAEDPSKVLRDFFPRRYCIVRVVHLTSRRQRSDSMYIQILATDTRR